MMLYDNLHFYTLGMAALLSSYLYHSRHLIHQPFHSEASIVHAYNCLHTWNTLFICAVKAVVELGIILSVNKNRDTYTEQKFSR